MAAGPIVRKAREKRETLLGKGLRRGALAAPRPHLPRSAEECSADEARDRQRVTNWVGVRRSRIQLLCAAGLLTRVALGDIAGFPAGSRRAYVQHEVRETDLGTAPALAHMRDTGACGHRRQRHRLHAHRHGCV